MKKSKPKKKTKVKKKKLTSIPVIKRRLFRLASQQCRDRTRHTCELCGMKKGYKHPITGKPQKIEAHHVMSRSNKNSPLQYDLRNLVSLCTTCHKVGKFSAHKHSLWFAQEFWKIRPKDAQWILDHSNDEVNLQDREVLLFIENCLKNNKPMNFDEINEKQLTFNF